jgi:hypothetical protein
MFKNDFYNSATIADQPTISLTSTYSFNWLSDGADFRVDFTVIDSNANVVTSAVGAGSVGGSFGGGNSYDKANVIIPHTEQYYYYNVKISLSRRGGWFGGGGTFQHTIKFDNEARAYMPQTIVNAAGFQSFSTPYSEIKVGGSGVAILGDVKIDAGEDTGGWWTSTPGTAGGTLLVKRNAAIASNQLSSEYDLFIGGNPAVTGSQGSIGTTGNIVAYVSDERVKTDFRPIEDAVNRLNNIGGYKFKWNEKAAVRRRGKEEYGLIAQEVLKEFPEMVVNFSHSPDDIEQGALEGKLYTVLYDRLVPVLVEAVKQQQEQIDELKKKIEEL